MPIVISDYENWYWSPGIYLIHNTFTDRYYVGQSKSLVSRLDAHVNALKQGRHSIERLQEDYTNYGDGTFEIIIVCVLKDTETLKEKEQVWLDYFRLELGQENCYNRSYAPIFCKRKLPLNIELKKSKKNKHIAKTSRDFSKRVIRKTKESVKKKYFCALCGKDIEKMEYIRSCKKIKGCSSCKPTNDLPANTI